MAFQAEQKETCCIHELTVVGKIEIVYQICNQAIDYLTCGEIEGEWMWVRGEFGVEVDAEIING
jgi:hypothetical protein